MTFCFLKRPKNDGHALVRGNIPRMNILISFVLSFSFIAAAITHEDVLVNMKILNFMVPFRKVYLSH